MSFLRCRTIFAASACLARTVSVASGVTLVCAASAPRAAPALAARVAPMAPSIAGLPLVSIIIPCHNAMPWLDECLASCATQDYRGPLEVSIFDDSSTDGSDACIR